MECASSHPSRGKKIPALGIIRGRAVFFCVWAESPPFMDTKRGFQIMRSLILTTVAAMAVAMPLAYAEDYASGAIKSMDTAKGEVLTDANGMTLYTFDKDASGTSNCYDACAVKWPPLAAAAGASAEGKYTLVERKDGAKQWAYDGKPLYLWQNDKKSGDVTGDGVGGVWHVAKE
jgi:predicted lipoprotein with Yx(FWY)xxD motif